MRRSFVGSAAGTELLALMVRGGRRMQRNAAPSTTLCSHWAKTVRMPLSKQRNKHIQHGLVEAAKLAPRMNPELALIHQKAMEKGNRNRATLVVDRKMVAWLLAADRENREFFPAEKREIRDGADTIDNFCHQLGHSRFADEIYRNREFCDKYLPHNRRQIPLLTSFNN